MTDADDACRIALELPGTSEDAPFDVSGKSFAWFYREKVEGQRGRVERRDVLAVRVAGEDGKQLLLAADPEKFFTTPHYNGYPAVLVRLAAVDSDELRELLIEAWRLRAPRKMVAAFDAAADGPG